MSAPPLPIHEKQKKGDHSVFIKSHYWGTTYYDYLFIHLVGAYTLPPPAHSSVQILLLTNAIRETDKYSNCHVSQSLIRCSFPFNSGRMDRLMVGYGWPGEVSLFIIRLLL